MTRINCIPVEELTDKHLLAEYRELPRALTLAIKHINKLVGVSWDKFPSKYTMGTGHVKFFYNRLAWLHERYKDLVHEMKQRDFNCNPGIYEPVLKSFDKASKKYPDYYNNWVPTEQAMKINRQRIKERLKETAGKRGD